MRLAVVEDLPTERLVAQRKDALPLSEPLRRKSRGIGIAADHRQAASDAGAQLVFIVGKQPPRRVAPDHGEEFGICNALDELQTDALEQAAVARARECIASPSQAGTLL